MAPEVLEGKGYSQSSEWWAFGCLIYELLVGVPPFLNKDKISLSQDNHQGLFDMISTSSPKLDFKFLKDDARDLLT